MDEQQRGEGSSKNGIPVKSFGTGTQVKLPGPAVDRPAVYDFGTPYDVMLEDLKAKDARLYAGPCDPRSYCRSPERRRQM